MITAESFPTPHLALRTHEPAELERVRAFANGQAAAAESARHRLAAELPQAGGQAVRAELLRALYVELVHWRYELATRAPHRLGAGVPLDAERFRTPITGHGPNTDRLGYLGRLRDGAFWDAETRTYRGGLSTPAHEIMFDYGQLALRRMDAETSESAWDALPNEVWLPDGTTTVGNTLVRGDRAARIAEGLIERLAARGCDTSRVEIGGELIYAITAPDAARRVMFDGALQLLSGEHVTVRHWQRARYLLFQAPMMKKGSDAVTRVFLAAVGGVLFDRAPILEQDCDLRCMVLGQAAATEMPADDSLHIS